MGVVCSVGHGVARFTAALRQGVSGIGFRATPAATAPRGEVAVAAELVGFNVADALSGLEHVSDELRGQAFGLTRRAPLCIQTAAIAAIEAWADAGLDTAGVDPERIGLVVAGNNIAQGYIATTYREYGDDPSFVNPRFALQFMDTNHVGVVSELLGVAGEGFTVGGASASGNVALIKAHQMVSLGLCDVCVVVGAMADLSALDLQAFYNCGAMSKQYMDEPGAACRPFDRGHDGFVYGQGSGCLILESAASAVARGAAATAELLGGAICLDRNSSTNPSVAGEARAMAQALGSAEIAAGEVAYINAHGSSSPLGDRTEAEAIKTVFADHLAKITVNSTKSMIGHCLWSAGTVEAIATIVQMRDGFIHPNLNLLDPIDPDIRFAGADAEMRPVQHAISNSFGFGGINSSLVLRAVRS